MRWKITAELSLIFCRLNYPVEELRPHFNPWSIIRHSHLGTLSVSCLHPFLIHSLHTSSPSLLSSLLLFSSSSLKGSTSPSRPLFSSNSHCSYKPWTRPVVLFFLLSASILPFGCCFPITTGRPNNFTGPFNPNHHLFFVTVSQVSTLPDFRCQLL